ncbi:MAG: mechanosensitive ion channel domain-containing protein [Bacteroidota bacterium]|nr:mechanosensitive ion channel domain-containing protein [Bacteroidota bacterium]
MKFDLFKIYKKLGMREGFAELMEVFTYILIIFSLTVLLWFISRRILRSFFYKVSKNTKSKFDDFLLKNKVPSIIACFPPILLLFFSLDDILSKYPNILEFIEILLEVLGTLITIVFVKRLLNSIRDYLKTLSNFRDKPIDSYIQVIMIFIWFFGIMVIFSIISGKDIGTFLATLGALSAVILLIFKDTILGFVASIQVTVNDIVRIGDWITMKSYYADGDVIEINLSTVKVQNFDKTITSIPTYKLVSDSFINWRGMSESGGRRIKRSILIKVSSIKFLDDEQLTKLKQIERISSFITKRKEEIEKENKDKGVNKKLLLNGRNMTNIGLYRRYALAYLKDHPQISQDLTVMVRQLAPSPEGVPLEIYVFVKDKVWVNYEKIMSDIFDHLLAAIPTFDLECFEYTSEKSFSK